MKKERDLKKYGGIIDAIFGGKNNHTKTEKARAGGGISTTYATGLQGENEADKMCPVVYADVNVKAFQFPAGFKVEVSGKAKGKKYKAGVFYLSESDLFAYLIKYEGESIFDLFTPARASRIFAKLIKKEKPRKVNKSPDKQAAGASPPPNLSGEFYAEFAPLKAFGIAMTEDYTKQAESWENRRNTGVLDKTNPFVLGNLKGSKVKVLFNGKAAEISAGENMQYPSTAAELRAYLTKAFGGAAYSILLGLAYLGNKTGKETFTISVPQLSKLLFGSNYKAGTAKKVLNTIDALQYSQITLTQPHGKGTVEHIFSPILIHEIYRDSKDKVQKIRLKLWPQDEGAKPFTKAAIPANIFNIRTTDFALVSYLLIESKHARAGYPIKANIQKAINAAGLAVTNKKYPRVARQKLKGKIERLAAAGITGKVLNVDNSAGIIEIENKSKAE